MTPDRQASSPQPRKRRRVRFLFLIVAIVSIAVFLIFEPRRCVQWPDTIRPPRHTPIRLSRPHGMAPTAFQAFIRACYQAKVSPNRITQTIGDSPRSVGYHLSDGVLASRGERIEYSAATDIHVSGLTDAQIARLVKALGKQGFAVWYRHEGKWQGVEHLHAVYAFLPMKPQLLRQVRLYLREENPSWERKWRRSRFNK